MTGDHPTAALPDREAALLARAEKAEKALAARRPFSDSLAERVIDVQVETLDQQYAVIAAGRKEREGLRHRAEKAEAAVERLRKICSAAANDYAGILTAMEKAVGPSFAEAFKATAKELHESGEFMRLAAEGREDGSIYDDELSKAKAEAAALREALTPSGETKVAYIGKFSFRFLIGRDLRGPVHATPNVPWTTINEIMAAIRAHADARKGKET